MGNCMNGTCRYTNKEQIIKVEMIKISTLNEKTSFQRGQITCDIAAKVGCNGADCSVLKENGIK